VVVANRPDPDNRELQILDWIKENGDRNRPGFKHVSQLVDAFHHGGPNGWHLCIVMELLGPRVAAVAEQCTNYRLNERTDRRVSRQLLLAVDFLHSCGVAHGGK
jgi:serine/threonine-protein kinase SRPK3